MKINTFYFTEANNTKPGNKLSDLFIDNDIRPTVCSGSEIRVNTGIRYGSGHEYRYRYGIRYGIGTFFIFLLGPILSIM